MHFIFKTDYLQDIRLIKHSGGAFWYTVLLALLLLAPAVLDDYYIGQLTQLLIFATAGVGLMLLTGYTGLISLGHAAFLGIGAYTEAVLLARGYSFLVSFPAAAIVTTIVGIIVGLPALRLAGIYLAIATLAFAFIIEEVLARWESATHGYTGMIVEPIVAFGYEFSDGADFYYLSAGLLIAVVLGSLNLLRAPTGRAMVAIRDSEIAAQSTGIHLAKYKTIAFAISAGITGMAGALFAHKLGFLSPESFTIFQSIELLVLVVVGGLGSIHGAIFGAIFVVVLPQAIDILKGYLPQILADAPGWEPGVFGLILLLFIIFEPLGLYGRWMKIKTYFAYFPLYKKATFKRQKSYMQSDRVR